MTLEQLNQRNERFQKLASSVADLLPSGNMLDFSSILIRSSRKISALLLKVLHAKSEMRFYQALEGMEEEMDEIIYALDKLDVETRNQKMPMIDEVLKRGYELLSLYSLCCDQIIEKKVKRKDEF